MNSYRLVLHYKYTPRKIYNSAGILYPKSKTERKLKMKTKTKIYAIIATIMTACYVVLIALSAWNLGIQMKINALKSDGRNVMYTDAAAFAEVCDEIDHLKTLKAWN